MAIATTETGDGMMTVTIKQLDGHSFNVKCRNDATVLGLKTLIMDDRNITMDRQRLIYRAQELTDNDKLLSEYGVTNGSVLHIVIRPIGGVPAAAPPAAQGQVAVDMPQIQYGGNGWGEGNQAAPMYGGPMGRGMGMGAGGAGAGAAGGMGRETFDVFRLSRFVKIFAIIDTVFLFLYGISTWIGCFILALFAMGGVYGAMKLRKHLLILYMICLVLEITLRCVLIYIADANTIDVILFVIMILIDLFVLKCTVQLYKAIGTLTPQQIETLVLANNRCL